ncbi:alanine--tRNA ligase [Brachybacterium huguangmaarense]|uniref:Alanine--tRNA ligase n=1 Tax=Brachybacterium huguangmaarense TaxID=1652028 RepID=A0ABY6FZC8_9MICO|nr:alanine--tRNA ligase [Brachybacterium huguangmaarense]UYG16283.1 alanine--tRNA ligase [Brachybacterium huguangmaarense]
MRTSEVRRRYLDFFAKKRHEIVPSASLVSADPSILFTVAGMVPFIPYIVGTERAPWPRAASVQKCIRTNDIENVGRTTRHGTFFQMAGNFSFGDYFKEGAIDFAWELLTSSLEDGGYALDGDRLWVTVWEHDEESYDVLTRRIGMDPRHIVKLTREEIFWSTGQPGPAGPCAEWHYDRGPEFGPEAVGGTVDPGGDRYLEIWNLVFDQFLRGEGSGKDYPLLGDLEQTAIDTGLGIERLAYLLQGKNNMYEIDQVFPVIEKAQELTGKVYGRGGEDDVRLRVIADHVRSAMMLVSDGVRPGNEGRGYVLRRLIRRAVRSMRLLGYDRPSMSELLGVSVRVMAESYPSLETDFARISDVVLAEEDAFRRTLETGTAIFDQVAGGVKSSGGATVSGQDAFRLHDTYGFPIDLTLEMAEEVGLRVDEEGFRSAMAEQRDRARADAASKKTGHTDTALYNQLLSARGGESVPFLGYTDDTAAATVESVLLDGRLVQRVEAPAEVEVILDRTPFYAEMGGQLADRGRISLEGGGIVEVDDVQAPIKGLTVHRGRLVEGALEQGSPAIASIDVMRRGAIARAHTATHMVHKALREELGENATQAGSENSPGRLRFDFRFGSSVPRSSLEQVEGRVNTLLQDELEVTDQQMPIDEARAAGAMALFGEKYGNVVRVVSIGGDWSKELCAGTHVRSTGYLGTVQLMGEASIGSGVRRIDALVGQNAYRFQAKEHALVSQLSELMRVSADDLPERVRSLTQRVKDMEKQLAAMRGAQLQAQAGTLAAQAIETAGVRLLVHDAGEGVGAGDLRTLVTDLRSRLGDDLPAVVAVAGSADGRAALVVATNAPAREAGLAAGALLRTGAEAMGGRGGGKDDLAQGGGGDPERSGAALDAVRAAVTAAGER